jgi:phosphosulfolactate phosphohydrolase-like enzyme
LGLERDLEVAAQVDALRVVPALDIPSWRIAPLLP